MSEIKISDLPNIDSGSTTSQDLFVIVNNGTTVNIDVDNIRPILLKNYNLTSESFDSGSDTQIPVSSQIYQAILDTSPTINEIYISSSDEINQDDYPDILVTTGEDQILLKLSSTTDGNKVNVSKIDTGSGYVRISSSYNDTILDEPYFDLYYQYETINLKYNSESANYIQI